MRHFSGLFTLNFLYIVLIAAQVAAIVFLCAYLPAALPLALSYALIRLASVAAACALFSRGGDDGGKCAWFMLLAVLPLAGALLFAATSIRAKPCGIVTAPPDLPAQEGQASAANAACGTYAAPYEEAAYFKCGQDYFTALLSAIEGARCFVYLEYYIIGRGRVFQNVVRALERARANGAEIKILADGIGSAFRLGRAERKKLKALGAEVRLFHRLVPLPQAGLNCRDHRKIAAIDGVTAFTGGINLADEYANLDSPYGYWKDTGVEVRGQAAQLFADMFLAMWEGSHTAAPAAAALRAGGQTCLPFYDSPPDRAFSEDAFLRAISAATERVYIMTPYFCAGGKLFAALSFAAARGVDVKVILPHVPDKKCVFEISKAYACSLAKSGVQFFEYTPGFLHAKCLLCDGGVFLGSYNFDCRSLHFNHECGVYFTGKMAEEAARDFAECLALSAPLSEGRLSFARRFSRFVLKLFSPLI